MNLYAFVMNEPVSRIDHLGQLVYMVFNVQEGLLSVTDLDTNESAMLRATSGVPELENNFDKEWSNGGPLPRGDYAILNRIKTGGELDPIQDNYGTWSLDGLDANPPTMEQAEGVVSLGCIPAHRKGAS